MRYRVLPDQSGTAFIAGEIASAVASVMPFTVADYTPPSDTGQAFVLVAANTNRRVLVTVEEVALSVICDGDMVVDRDRAGVRS